MHGGLGKRGQVHRDGRGRARQAKTRKGVMKTKASAGVGGKHKEGKKGGGGGKGPYEGYPDLSANKNENISPTFVLEEKKQ